MVSHPVPSLYPEEGRPSPLEQEAEWGPEPVFGVERQPLSLLGIERGSVSGAVRV